MNDDEFYTKYTRGSTSFLHSVLVIFTQMRTVFAAAATWVPVCLCAQVRDELVVSGVFVDSLRSTVRSVCDPTIGRTDAKRDSICAFIVAAAVMPYLAIVRYR